MKNKNTLSRLLERKAQEIRDMHVALKEVWKPDMTQEKLPETEKEIMRQLWREYLTLREELMKIKK